jgi:hypothetical protein
MIIKARIAVIPLARIIEILRISIPYINQRMVPVRKTRYIKREMSRTDFDFQAR